ncbi:hypothetical protein BH23ACT10_BH23ACT10_06710 [soil metagenome]
MSGGGVIMQERPVAPLAVVALNAAHLDAVVAIESRVAAAGWSRRIFEREMVADRSRCYLVAQRVADDAAEVLGYGGMQLLAGEAHITNVAVDPAYRRRGIATLLMVELLREARARDVESATLEVRVGNIAAQRLYAGLGFRPVGVRPKYYNAATDALVMWAHDIGGAEFGRLLRARDPASGAPMVDDPCEVGR